MTDAENTSQPSTPTNTSGSTGSPKETGEDAPSPEQLQDPFSVGSSTPTQSTSYPALVVKGGSISDITAAVAKDVAKGSPVATQEATLAFFQRNVHGFVGGLAMRCQGQRCPILDVCPLHETGQALPLKKPCPFEAGIVQTWVNKHLMSLGIDDFAAPENSFDIDLLYELAAHELIKWKAAHHLSKKGNIIDDRQVAANMQGDAIFAEVISPALEILDTHNRITMKIRDSLLATRKSQIQAGRDMGDPSKKAADLAGKARAKALERLGRGERIQDAEFDVKDKKYEDDTTA